MKKILFLLLFIPLVTFGQKRTVTELGVETIEYNKSLKYVYDGNPFNDNKEILTLKLPMSPYKFPWPHSFTSTEGMEIQMSKSDISPFKIEFRLLGGLRNGDHKPWKFNDGSGFWFFEFIFDNDKTTYMKFNESSSEKIVNLDDEFFIKFKKHNKVFVRNSFIGLDGSKTHEDFAVDLKKMTAGFNKFSLEKTPSMKNKSLYRVANVNPFNLDKYIDKFILDAKKNHNINLSDVNKYGLYGFSGKSFQWEYRLLEYCSSH